MDMICDGCQDLRAALKVRGMVEGSKPWWSGHTGLWQEFVSLTACVKGYGGQREVRDGRGECRFRRQPAYM